MARNAEESSSQSPRPPTTPSALIRSRADPLLIICRCFSFLTALIAILCVFVNALSAVRSFKNGSDVFGGVFRCYAVVIALFVAVAETEWGFIIKFWRVGVDGLKVLKPHTRNGILLSGVSSRGINQGSSYPSTTKGIVENCGGVNIELRMVILEDDESMEMVKWVVENLKFSVKQPIEAVATKGELEHLAFLCRSEVDSMGRITAGILRVLKLDRSIGQAAIDQLSNLGSEGLDRILTPEKFSRRSSVNSVTFSPLTNASPNRNLESTVASLEAAVSGSQAKCAALITDLSNPGTCVHLEEIKQLNQKLENMQILLSRLRTQI